MASSFPEPARRLALALLLLGSATAPSAAAPAPGPAPHAVRGLVLRPVAGADSVRVGGARVVLHRVGTTVQGPVDSTLADARGAFAFRFTPDSGAIYLLSSRYAGIEYFSSPLALTPLADSAARVVVYDTATSAPLSLSFRNLVVNRGSGDGARRVIELMILRNTGLQTAIGRDSAQPVWGMLLPRGALAFQPGPGDFSPETIELRNDSLVVSAPVSPGDKQIIIEYTLPAVDGGLRFPFTPTTNVNVLLEDRTAKLSGLPLVASDSDRIQGKVYSRWSGSVTTPGTLLIGVPNPRAIAKQLVALLAAAAGTALAAVTLVAFRRRGAAAPAPVRPARPAAALVDDIARIDVRLRDPALPDGERRLLLADRVALASLAQRALAAERGPA